MYHESHPTVFLLQQFVPPFLSSSLSLSSNFLKIEQFSCFFLQLRGWISGIFTNENLQKWFPRNIFNKHFLLISLTHVSNWDLSLILLLLFLSNFTHLKDFCLIFFWRELRLFHRKNVLFLWKSNQKNFLYQISWLWCVEKRNFLFWKICFFLFLLWFALWKSLCPGNFLCFSRFLYFSGMDGNG